MANQKTTVFQFLLINLYFFNILNASCVSPHVFGKAIGEITVVKAYIDPKKTVTDAAKTLTARTLLLGLGAVLNPSYVRRNVGYQKALKGVCSEVGDEIHKTTERIFDGAYVLGARASYAVVDSSKAAYVAALDHPEITGVVVGVSGAGLIRLIGGSKRDMLLVGCPVGAVGCVVTQEMQKKRLGSAVRLGVNLNLHATTDQLEQAKALEGGAKGSLDLSQQALVAMDRAAGAASGLQNGNTAILQQAIAVKKEQQRLGLEAGAACSESDNLLKKTIDAYEQQKLAREGANQASLAHNDASRDREAWYAVVMPSLGKHVDNTRQAVADSSSLLKDLLRTSQELGSVEVRAQAASSDSDKIARLSEQNLALAKKE